VRKAWGGGVMGVKSQAKTRAKERLIEKELLQRAYDRPRRTLQLHLQ